MAVLDSVGPSRPLRGSLIVGAPPLPLLLHLLLLLVMAAAAAAGPALCRPQADEPVLSANGPDDRNEPYCDLDRFVVTGGQLFLIPLPVASAMQAVSVRFFPDGARNTGELTVRAALYDWNSALLAQTELRTLTAGAELVQAELRFARGLELTPGRYGVGLWFAPRPASGADWGVNLTVTVPATMYSRSVGASEAFDRSNGSFPGLLAPFVKWNWLNTECAALVQLVGLACATALPAAPISLNESLVALLENLRTSAGGRPPGMGAGVLQLPLPLSSPLSRLSGSTAPDDAVCPFTLAAVAVSGVRRADAVQPEPVQVTDRWQLSNYSFALTAVMAHQAVEERLLRLDTTVADVLPYLPRTADTAGGMRGDCGCGSSQGYFAQSQYACGARIHPSWQNVTVAHLLTQMSGLVTLTVTISGQLPELRAMEARGGAENCTGYSVPSRRYLLSKLLALPITLPPRSPALPADTLGASAINGLVLGCMLEELHGREWELLASAILQRLKMDTAGFGPLSPAVPLNESAPDVYGHWFGSSARLVSTAQDVPAAWAPGSSLHASIADWARLVACQLQEGRDMSAAGFPAPTTGPAPPYLLTADTWQSIHRREFYPDDWLWEPQSFTLSSLQSWNSTAYPAHLDEQSRTFWWSSASRVVAHADPPYALLVTANWGQMIGFRPGDYEVDNRAKEAVQALQTLYEAWWQQQQQQQPGDTARAGPLDSTEEQSVLIALSLAVLGILLLTAAIVVKVRWGERSAALRLDIDEPLLRTQTQWTRLPSDHDQRRAEGATDEPALGGSRVGLVQSSAALPSTSVQQR